MLHERIELRGSAPAISGSAQQGQTLSASPGTWTGSPSSYAYEWKRCDSAGANCAPISGATAATYTLAEAEVGKTVRVAVTAPGICRGWPKASRPPRSESCPWPDCPAPRAPARTDCGRGGWLQLSRDGRFLFVGDSGEVIETATRTVLTTLPTPAQTKKSIEVDWQNGVPVATSGRTGVGYVE